MSPYSPPRLLRLLPLLLTLFAVLMPGVANAQSGLVIRLENAGEPLAEPVVIALTNSEGEVAQVELRDDGSPPDVQAGDQHYSGATIVSGDTFEAALSLGGEVNTSSTVEWPGDGSPRDLILVATEGLITMEARSAGGGQQEPEAQEQAGGPVSTDPSAPSTGAPPSGEAPIGATAPAQRPTAATFPDAGSDSGDGALLLALGVGLVVLAVLGFLWYRSRQDVVSSGRPGSVTRLPEPGLLGAGTPSLSDGLSMWVVADGALDDFVLPMLRTLAQHHRVLLVAPARFQVPPVFGGPVYQASNLRPVHVGDVAEELEDSPGMPLAVLVLAEQMDSETLGDYADLMPPDVGVVVALGASVSASVPTVQVARSADGWTLKVGETSATMRETGAGLTRA